MPYKWRIRHKLISFGPDGEVGPLDYTEEEKHRRERIRQKREVKAGKTPQEIRNEQFDF